MQNQNFILCASLALVASCASAGVHSASPGEPTRVALFLYKNGLVLELVNEAHTAPVAAYSETRSSSTLKVVDDKTMSDLVRYLGKHGFSDHEEVGRAPRGAGPYILAFEIESPNGTSHWGTTAADSVDKQRNMQESYRHFIGDVFNRVQALQTVENPEGSSLFDKPVPTPRR